MRRAIGKDSQHEIELKVAESKDNQYGSYPVIKVRIQEPRWVNNWFTVTSSVLSGFTISIIPGYMYRSSEVTFQRILPDKFGNLTATQFAYTAKRHYVFWLPLWMVGNFTETVQVFTEPRLYWDEGYKPIFRQFFRDAAPKFDEYQTWLDSQPNVMQ